MGPLPEGRPHRGWPLHSIWTCSFAPLVRGLLPGAKLDSETRACPQSAQNFQTTKDHYCRVVFRCPRSHSRAGEVRDNIIRRSGVG